MKKKSRIFSKETRKKFNFNSKALELLFVTTLLILGIVGLVFSTYLFFIGFHNLDLAFNGCIIANDLDLDYREWRDQYELNKSMKLTDFYIIGLKQMISAIFYMGASGFTTGYFLLYLLSEIPLKKRRRK